MLFFDIILKARRVREPVVLEHVVGRMGPCLGLVCRLMHTAEEGGWGGLVLVVVRVGVPAGRWVVELIRRRGGMVELTVHDFHSGGL